MLMRPCNKPYRLRSEELLRLSVPATLYVRNNGRKMKTVFCFAVVAAVLSALAGPARSLPLAADGQMGRWKRQGGEFWKCSHTVSGCAIKFCCEAIPELDLDTLTCHLDGRDFECESIDPAELEESYSLCFSIDANLATVNDANTHRMVINVRGVHGNTPYGLPWHFNFRVDPFYCSSTTQPPTTSSTTETPVTTTEAPVTTEGTTTTTPTTEVVTVTSSTTMTPTTQQPTTQPTTQATTRPTTQQPTTESTTQPTTQQPTTESTTQPTTQQPTTESTTQPTSEQPTTPDTEQPSPSQTVSPSASLPSTQQVPTQTPTSSSPIAICNAGRNSAGELIILCTSEATIANISCEVNGQVVPCSYSSGLVTIDGESFSEGQNVIELVITYNNGQFYIVTMTYELQTQTPTSAPPSAHVECTARFSVTSGMEVTCIVNNDFTGSGITSIRYNVNDQGEEEASSIPTFVIGTDKFRNGRNRVVVDITHSVYGSARVPMDIDLNIPSTPPPPPCQVSCSYRGIVGAVEFVCSVSEGDGNLSSVGYSLNGNSGSDLPATFQIPMAQFISGNNDISLTFSVVCNGQEETIEHRVSLSVQLPPPSTFSVSNVRASSSSGVSGVRISYSIRGDNLHFSVTITGQLISLYGYTLNGATDTTFVVTPEVPLHKNSLTEGENTLQLTVYYGNNQQADFTITFDVQK